MIAETLPSWKETGWNGLRLQCPQSWDVIVSGDHHLLFENDFHPVLELRWQSNQGKMASSSQTILNNLQKDNGLFPVKSLPASWEKCSEKYKGHLLLDGGKKTSRAALLTCRQCGTQLLFYFFQPLPPTHSDITTLFNSLCCHKEAKKKTVWAIQDFRFLLPDRYTLDTYNFGAGLTRISFKYESMLLHICRLAPASHRLQSTDLIQLLMTLGDVEIDRAEITETKNMVSHSSHPRIYRQILSRFKRKLPFHEMYLRHHHQSDRLTGLFLLDKKPIPKNCAEEILNSYEIFPC